MGSSGGSSGGVNYPDYMKDWHAAFIGTGDTTTNVTEAIDALLGESPYSGISAYDPDSDIANYIGAVNVFSAFVTALDPSINWDSFVNAAKTTIGDDFIVDAVAANDALIDDRLTSDILPRFQSGMRDINAVMSSAFVIGQSILEGFAQRDKNKLVSDLNVQKVEWTLRGTDQIITLLNLKLEFNKIVMHYSTEAHRIKAVLKKEEIGEQLDIDEKDALWDISLFQHGNNALAAIAGSSGPTLKAPNKMASAVGGALSGAAAGAMYGATQGSVVSPGWGTLIGGVIGAGAGLLSASD